MFKVVYNDCYGGFGLSAKAESILKDLGHEDTYYIPRHHPDLIYVVELLGQEANSRFSDLKIKQLKGDKYYICEYDGLETVIEDFISCKQY